MHRIHSILDKSIRLIWFLSRLELIEIGRIEVMNKRDLLGEAQLEALSIRFPHAVFTSTKTKEGLDRVNTPN